MLNPETKMIIMAMIFMLWIPKPSRLINRESIVDDGLVDICGDGPIIKQNGLSLVASSGCSAANESPLAFMHDATFFFFLLFGDVFRLDLKLLFLGTLTIHEGGTMSCRKQKCQRRQKLTVIGWELTLAWTPRSQVLSFSQSLAHEAFLIW